MNGALVKVNISTFSSSPSMLYIITMPKISLYRGPIQPFLKIDHDFGNICYLKKLQFCCLQNMGHIGVTKCKICGFSE